MSLTTRLLKARLARRRPALPPAPVPPPVPAWTSRLPRRVPGHVAAAAPLRPEVAERLRRHLTDTVPTFPARWAAARALRTGDTGPTLFGTGRLPGNDDLRLPAWGVARHAAAASTPATPPPAPASTTEHEWPSAPATAISPNSASTDAIPPNAIPPNAVPSSGSPVPDCPWCGGASRVLTVDLVADRIETECTDCGLHVTRAAPAPAPGRQPPVSS